ncbi:hypothetical protein [Streptomyces sp. NPDC018947]|uniref:hypothetical protein n=1 Tax=Streptomyces sp. NPDC018947 TaxID=3365054 RepID=UPI00378D7AFF
MTTLIAMAAIAFAPDHRDRELDEIGDGHTSPRPRAGRRRRCSGREGTPDPSAGAARARVVAAERTRASGGAPGHDRARSGTPGPEARYCAGRDAAMMGTGR